MIGGGESFIFFKGYFLFFGKFGKEDWGNLEVELDIL